MTGVVSGVISSTESESEESECFHFLPIPLMSPSLMIQWKLDCRSRKHKRKTQPITRSRIEHCDWFTLPLLLATPTMQFSLDRKQRSHKRMQCSASDSVGLIFSRSHRSTLLITTPTTTPSLVKTSETKKLLKKLARIEASFIWRQQFANVFADCYWAVHTHQLEFANFSLPCEGRLREMSTCYILLFGICDFRWTINNYYNYHIDDHYFL